MKYKKFISAITCALLAFFSLALAQAEEASKANPLCQCKNCTCENCACDGMGCKCENCGGNPKCACQNCTCKDCQCQGGKCQCENCPGKATASQDAQTAVVTAPCKCGQKEASKTARAEKPATVVKN
jgi:hypothetical protein